MTSGIFRRKANGLMLVSSVAALVAACSSNDPPPRSSASISRPAFTEAEYGVRTSPRLAGPTSRIAKGGGHFKLGSPYKVAGRWYVPNEDRNYDRRGIASWYGADFHGRKTSNGEVFDMRALTAAHPTFPLPSYAYVTNLDNNRTVLVRVNDRGPYVADRIIDMSHASATALGYVGHGKSRVRVRYAGRAPLNGDDRREQAFLREQPWAGGRDMRVASEARIPQAAVYDAPYRAPAAPSGWSPTAYRSALAGKPMPSYLGGPRLSDDNVSYVQVGSYSERSEAERMRRLLTDVGPVEVASRAADTRTAVYKVRIGPLSQARAAATLSALVADGFSDAKIVRD